MMVGIPSVWASKGIVTLTLEPGNNDKAAQTKVWVPYPVSNLYQKIREVRIKGNMTESAVYVDPKNGAPHCSRSAQRQAQPPRHRQD